jgi:hypothetical protein
MDGKSFVDSLFADYVQSDALADFKAELTSNLEARIAAMTRKGMNEREAFDAAARELSDVSTLACELSLTKRKEVFAERYLDSRRYITPARALCYALFGVTLLFGFITGAMAFLSANSLSAGLGTLLAFAPLSIAGFTFLGLSQETAASSPMKKRRAALYAAAAFLLAFALTLAPLAWVSAEASVEAAAGGSFGPLPLEIGGSAAAALGVVIAFALPAAALFIYLGLTEKSRLKPWAAGEILKQRRAHYAHRYGEDFFASPREAARFGVITGAIWMFAFTLFALLWYFANILVALAAFPAATGATLLLQGCMFAKNPAPENEAAAFPAAGLEKGASK